jgi:hypothetical protein
MLAGNLFRGPTAAPPELVGGVNLLSRHDFIMTADIKESFD